MPALTRAPLKHAAMRSNAFKFVARGHAICVGTRGFLPIMNKVPQVFRNPGGSPALRGNFRKLPKCLR